MSENEKKPRTLEEIASEYSCGACDVEEFNAVLQEVDDNAYARGVRAARAACNSEPPGKRSLLGVAVIGRAIERIDLLLGAASRASPEEGRALPVELLEHARLLMLREATARAGTMDDARLDLVGWLALLDEEIRDVRRAALRSPPPEPREPALDRVSAWTAPPPEDSGACCAGCGGHMVPSEFCTDCAPASSKEGGRHG